MCIVSSIDEVDSPSSFQIVPVDLNPFFEDDGKIYGYQGLKVELYKLTLIISLYHSLLKSHLENH